MQSALIINPAAVSSARNTNNCLIVIGVLQVAHAAEDASMKTDNKLKESFYGAPYK